MTFSLDPKKVKKISTKYRKIVTDIPVPESIKIIQEIFKYESRSMHGQLPIVWNKAQDFTVSDYWGNQWIDFSSTIFVSNAGHGNQKIIDKINNTISKPLLHTYTYASKERSSYLKFLIENTPKNFEKAYLVSAGTEATEAAFKLMRLHGTKQGKRKNGIICIKGNWHGRTTGAQLMSDNENQRSWIGFDDKNIHHIRFPYPWLEGTTNPKKFLLDELESLKNKNEIDFKKDICGVMLETFQGWAGLFYPNEYIEAMAQFAKDNNLLVTFDEMQAGFGRTGKLFGYMHYNIVPDLICCGKGTTSSLPLSIVLGSKKIMDLPEIGSMSSTHSANPLSCVAGEENLKTIIEDGLIENSHKLGLFMHQELNKIKNKYSKYIKYVFGKGLIAGILFYDNEEPLSHLCSKICEIAMQNGLILVHTGRESIKVGPPLSISYEALKEGLQVLDEAIAESLND